MTSAVHSAVSHNSVETSVMPMMRRLLMRRMVMRMPLFLTQEGFYFSQVAMLSFVLRSLPFAGDRRVGHLQGLSLIHI